MNGLKVVKVAELRNKLAVIPAKIILAALIVGAYFWDTDLAVTAGKISEKPLLAGASFITIYGVLSYLYFFIKLFHNYIVGIIVAAAAAYGMYSLKDRFAAEQFNIIMILGGPVLDILRFIRYRNMKREVLEESEELRDKIDDIYDNVRGYDEGYDDGYERGYSHGRNEQIDYYEKERMPELPTGFFEGCKSPDAIKRRYRDLCKVYHPDNGNGSEAIFAAICDEYNRLMDE